MSELQEQQEQNDEFDTEYDRMAKAYPRLLDSIRELEQQRDAVLKLLKVAKCPACDGSGVIIEEHRVPRCCGNYRGNGDCCSEPVPVQELEYQECQWCAELRAIFALKEGK